jgi:ProP effector
MTEKICPGSDPGPKEKPEAASLSKTKVTKSPARCDLTVEAVLQLLQERWPRCFRIHERDRRPLKVGIFTDIMSALDGAVTHAELAKAIGCYVGNRVYLKKVRAGAVRIGLDGLPAGKVVESEELHARTMLGGSDRPPENPVHVAMRYDRELEERKKHLRNQREKQNE